MAGDWIKMRTSLLTNPKVNGIARILEESPEVARSLSTGFSGPMHEIVTRTVMRHVTVSSLLVIWGAANEHTKDGVFSNADLSDVDDMVGIPGFGDAMSQVGWLEYDAQDNSVTLPNFNEYNTSGDARSAGAKTSAQRQKEYRDRKKSQESDVTRDVTRNRREEKRREESNTVPNGTDGDAVKPASDLSKDELWKAGKSLLSQSGMPQAQCGSFVGKLVKDYGDAVVVDAVRAAVVARPADPAEYLKASCMRAAGQRATNEPAWRAEQRARTQQAAPGVAAGAVPADQFFIETEAIHVAPRRLG